jgi:drug/metabolite transporter (DMT)-like permease
MVSPVSIYLMTIQRSLEHTSLDHSLLFVTAHPLVIVLGHVALRLLKRAKSFPSIGEALGSVLGFAGLLVTLLDVNNEGGATIIGDVAAFGGAGKRVCHVWR